MRVSKELREKITALRTLERRIRANPGWWTFEREYPIRGFSGPGPYMIVGDQPSESPWPPCHPNRLLFYGILKAWPLGYSAHLTDVIKRGGPGSESARAEPADMPVHLDILRTELEIVQPTRIIALGGTAEGYLRKYFPELEPRMAGIIHWGKRATDKLPGVPAEFRRQLRRALTCTQREVVSSRARPSVRYKVLKSLAGGRCPRQMQVLHRMIANRTES
jgi:hypothetical protein